MEDWETKGRENQERDLKRGKKKGGGVLDCDSDHRGTTGGKVCSNEKKERREKPEK